MKKKLSFLAIMLSMCVFAQYKFLNTPKLSEQDVKSTESTLDKEAPAEVLYRSYHYRIDYNGYMYTTVVDRVKIYKKDLAGDFLDKEIFTYDDNRGSREVLTALKAYTYNFENGKIQSTKVDSDSKFKSKENKNYTVNKFAFANVKDGSVVELTYQVTTPYYSSTPKVYLEEEIPVRYVEYLLDTPKVLGYNINYKGELSPKYREVKEASYYGGDYQVYRYGFENIPAFKKEEFVLNPNNYKTSIKAEINSVMQQNGILKPLAISWEDVRKRMMDHEDFGQQLAKTSLVKDVLPADIKSISEVNQRAQAIYAFVQKNYTYNEEDGIAVDKGIRNLINTKSGTSSEINLLLTMLLRSTGIKADPIVLSTISRGMILHYSPSIEQFNYVISSYENAGNITLLDATSKHAKMGMLKPGALNYTGYRIKESAYDVLNIFNPEYAETYLTVNAKMNADGSFEGEFSDFDTDINAWSARENYKENKEKYQKQYKDLYKFPISNLQSGDKNDDFETTFNFTSDTFTDVLGSKLVFNPLLFLYTQNHSFNQTQKRRSPIEHLSKNKRIKKVTITLPDGYVFQDVPKSKKFKTPDEEVVYSYVVTQEGNNKLTVETTRTFSMAHYEAGYYPVFTQLFDNITSMEGQMVTAVKK